MIKKILNDIGLPDNSSRIYMRLLETGHSSARQLAENLNIPRPTVYDNLKLLIKNSLVVEKEEENKKIFGIDDVKNLQNLITLKIDSLKSDQQKIIDVLPDLKLGFKSLEPKIKFYSGTEGIKQVLKDLLWYENIESLTMWPINEMVKILGAEYLENLNIRRIRQKISIRGIWPQNKSVNFKDYPFLGIGKEHLRQLRFAPKSMSWNMSYWLYADKVAFISSEQEYFGFIVHSRDFAELLKSQFEVIWKLSKPIKPQPQYTDKFLEKVKKSK